MIYKYFNSTKKEVFIRALFYFSLILFGLNFYKDFGVSMDDIGYKFVANKDYNFIKLLINNFGENKFDEIVRDYSTKIETISSFFFLIVFFINDLSGLDTTIISKLLLFFFFISGCHLIFLIIDKRFNNKILSYLAVLFLFSSPRIFSEAFINSRDIFYLILFIVNLYLVQKIFYEFSYKNLLYLSSIIGISLNVRIFELVFIIILIFFLIIEYENKIKKKNYFLKYFF